MTAYKEPLDLTEADRGDARGRSGCIGHGMTPGRSRDRTMECTAERGFRSIERRDG
jgi:hypothetical protein